MYFHVAPLLQILERAMVMDLNKVCVLNANVISVLVCAGLTFAETVLPTKTKQTKCEGTEISGTDAPTPVDPYPLIDG